VTGIAMIGVKSILDTWWQLSGIFGAGMLGLFLLGMVSRQAQNREALLATIIGVFVIAWLSLPGYIPEKYAILRSTLNVNMTIVIGTMTIFCMGILLTRLREYFGK
jgi:SSS family solute:Na+ symporter